MRQCSGMSLDELTLRDVVVAVPQSRVRAALGCYLHLDALAAPLEQMVERQERCVLMRDDDPEPVGVRRVRDVEVGGRLAADDRDVVHHDHAAAV